MNVRAANFTVIFSTGATGHEAITKIDQTAQCDKGEKNGLFQRHRVGNAGLFFENGGLPNMGPQAQSGFF